MKVRILLFAALLMIGCESGMVADLPADESSDAIAQVLHADVVSALENQNATDPDAAAVTLGRVLFYERQLSRDASISCASCHRQNEGFADSNVLSEGVGGALTARHSMSVANTATYPNGRMFWDERAASLEDQALNPIQNPDEMDLTLDEMISRLSALDYYDILFEQAFGDNEVLAERVAEALAAFQRTIVTRNSRWDEWLAAGPPLQPGQPAVGGDRGILTAQEEHGRQLFFSPRTQCAVCHSGPDMVGDRPFNNGLDASTNADQGAGQGRFKTASLRNIALTGPYMHDGRFATLREVIEHYSSGIQDHPNLDPRLRNPGGRPIQMRFSDDEMDALIAFLRTVTDESLAIDERFSDPFIR